MEVKAGFYHGIYRQHRASQPAAATKHRNELLVDAESFASLLMVKDFNSKGFTTSDEFMLSADVPLLAVKDVVAEPVNPFSGRRIDEVSKPKQEQLLLYSFNVNCGTQFIAGDWYTVNGDIWNKNAWHSVANKAVLTAER